MRVDFHKHFDKQYKKLSDTQKSKFKLRLAVFVEDRYDVILNNHALKGDYNGYRSINVAGDLRAIYIEHSTAHIEFTYIGSHSQLYG